ncbi:transglycosylase family protein [Streptomyces flaveolus]|uniref:LysM peptidoglycan-binding domain-containing protein n=1 Tax=Streptomyces flaveolus TaxID=67297 RepID=UPI00331D5B73
MLSGNGRHRRPRQAPALVVAAGVTGSAIAIPLLGATGAHAADGTNWDRVAECETGGAWSQNSGNGYYGGLQLSQDIWEQYGGLGYASSADQASRSQQIAVAEKVLAAQGIAAWPTCGLLAGLGNDSGILSGGTGSPGDGASAGERGSGISGAPGSSGLTDSSESVPESSSSAAPSPSQSPSQSPSRSGSPSPSVSATTDAASDSGDETAKSDSSTPSGTPADGDAQAPDDAGVTAPGGDESDKSGQSGAASGLTGTEETTTGRHRGDSAEEGAVDGRTAESSGRHASRDESGGRGLTDGSYTVRSGDSLWGIADSLDLTGGWHTLYADNKDVVGTDPDHILPGQTLTVGGEPVENQG